jgi:hypothetical protein
MFGNAIIDWDELEFEPYDVYTVLMPRPEKMISFKRLKETFESLSFRTLNTFEILWK